MERPVTRREHIFLGFPPEVPLEGFAFIVVSWLFFHKVG